MYNCENWTLNKTDRRKIETAEMNFLRSLAAYTLMDHKYNTDTQAELNIYQISNEIEQWE
jgi:hypothetical protein